jgi:RNA polymerase subunit RPABC4/transcription elongation factor Spt4
MVAKCPKCGRNVADDSVYCPYCGQGIKETARTTQVSVAGTLMIVAAVASLIFLILSIRALLQIYSWYPSGVAEGWIMYDLTLTVFSFAGFLFGFVGGIFSLTRRYYRLTIASAVLCTISGAGAWTVSMIIPFARTWYSLLFYFLPTFTTALVATVLIYRRKAEFAR